VVNVGSVGLSCDKIGGATCYALLDGDDIVFLMCLMTLKAQSKL